MEADQRVSSSLPVAKEGVIASTPKPLPRLATTDSPAQQGVQQSWLVLTEVVYVLMVWSEDCVQTEADNPLSCEVLNARNQESNCSNTNGGCC